MQDYEYLLSSLKNVKGIGSKTIQLFFKKKIKTIFDLLWHLPISKIETSKTTDINLSDHPFFMLKLLCQ